ncbi:hypothetical protein CHISP_2183 [Chitinispirillum alkaliphilum]|nr:hypothetical protein CHISP_2183 [Chitinispirillum alkaliphilum]
MMTSSTKTKETVLSLLSHNIKTSFVPQQFIPSKSITTTKSQCDVYIFKNWESN